MIFQNYALYPHMSVRQNLAYGLKLQKLKKQEWQRRVHEVATTLGLEELLDRRPAALSGGQRQRVAMGRAIVREPKAFLMDEPLSNLDAKLRVSMRAELAKLHERLGVTTVYVTHDQVEAMTLGQRVAVLLDGTLQQVDTPHNLFHRPANLFVAAFIGSPSMNLVDARLDGGSVRFADVSLALPESSPLAGLDRDVILGMRPTCFEHSTTSNLDLPRIRVRPDVVEDLGPEYHVIFTVDAPRVSAEAVRAAAESDEGDEGKLFAEDRATFTVVLDARQSVSTETEVELAVDHRRLHFFDPETGLALDGAGALGCRRLTPRGLDGCAAGGTSARSAVLTRRTSTAGSSSFSPLEPSQPLAVADPGDRPGNHGHDVPGRRRGAPPDRSRLPRDRPAFPTAGVGRARSRRDLGERGERRRGCRRGCGHRRR